jgi:hypothetical protein
MTRDDINKIIFDNELFHGVLTGMGVVMDIEHLEKFANIVAAAEREACAKGCEHFGGFKDGYSCAAYIRARGQKCN